jgi:hypothetical protein
MVSLGEEILTNVGVVRARVRLGMWEPQLGRVRAKLGKMARVQVGRVQMRVNKQVVDQ